jgi:NAD(P)-dependent dehydrogenase (short-subunit alcohol dehydrogenase family)
VAVGDVLDDRGRETVDALAAAGGEAIYTHLDVTREEDWRAAIAATTERLGGLDILVNNAGVFLGTKLSVAALRESAQRSVHGSIIVNLSSVAGLVGSSNDPLYSMTKGGVTLFTKSAALEFARKGYRIRVNSIHPGTIDTEMGDQVLAIRARNLGSNDLEPARQQTLTRIPIGRMGSVTDIAKGIVFLASDDAAFMTGAGLVVDGGITAQ